MEQPESAAKHSQESLSRQTRALVVVRGGHRYMPAEVYTNWTVPSAPTAIIPPAPDRPYLIVPQGTATTGFETKI